MAAPKKQPNKPAAKRRKPSPSVLDEPTRHLLEGYEARLRQLELRSRHAPLSTEMPPEPPAPTADTIAPFRAAVASLEARVRQVELKGSTRLEPQPVAPSPERAEPDMLRREWRGFQQITAQRVTDVRGEVQRVSDRVEALPKADFYCRDCGTTMTPRRAHQELHTLAERQQRTDKRFPIFKGQDSTEGHLHRFASGLQLSSYLAYRTFEILSVVSNEIVPLGNIVKVNTAAGAATLRGIVGGIQTRMLIVGLDGANTLTLKHADPAVPAGNRMELANDADIVLRTTDEDWVALLYISDRWQMIRSPLGITTTRGDIITRGVSYDQRLALGAVGAVLNSNGTDPVWTVAGRTIILTAAGGTPTGTAGCAAAAAFETATNKVNYISLDFDTATSESAFWVIPAMPGNYDGGVITLLQIAWTAAGGTVGQTVAWRMRARGYQDDDAIDQAMGSYSTIATDALLAVGDYHFKTFLGITFTPAGNPGANKGLIIELNRDVANDNLSVDAQFIGAQLMYTTNKYSDA